MQKLTASKKEVSKGLTVDDIEIIYQGWNNEAVIQKTSISIPGIGGIDATYDTAQPWQCKPFLDGNTIGFELLWHLPTVVIESQDGIQAEITDTWTEVTRNKRSISQFADGHVGINAGIRIKMPYGWGGFVLSHPEWMADPYNNTLPCMVPGVLEFDWWPNFFFVVAKVPPIGKKYILEFGKPFCQIIPIKTRQKFQLRKANQEEIKELEEKSKFIADNYSKISTHTWSTKSGDNFGNVYKVIANEIKKSGEINWEEIKKLVKPDEEQK